LLGYILVFLSSLRSYVSWYNQISCCLHHSHPCWACRYLHLQLLCHFSMGLIFIIFDGRLDKMNSLKHMNIFFNLLRLFSLSYCLIQWIFMWLGHYCLIAKYISNKLWRRNFSLALCLNITYIYQSVFIDCIWSVYIEIFFVDLRCSLLVSVTFYAAWSLNFQITLASFSLFAAVADDWPFFGWSIEDIFWSLWMMMS